MTCGEETCECDLSSGSRYAHDSIAGSTARNGHVHGSWSCFAPRGTSTGQTDRSDGTSCARRLARNRTPRLPVPSDLFSCHTHPADLAIGRYTDRVTRRRPSAWNWLVMFCRPRYLQFRDYLPCPWMPAIDRLRPYHRARNGHANTHRRLAVII